MLDGLGKPANFINQAHLDRILPHQDSSDIPCQLTRLEHQAAQFLFRNIGVFDNKADDPVLHFVQVFIGLGDANDQAGEANGVDGHGGRFGNERMIGRHGYRHADAIQVATNKRLRPEQLINKIPVDEMQL